MEQIAGWLKQVAAAVVIAGFMEMILPGNALKGVVKLVIGMVVIMILLQPLLLIFRILPGVEWSLGETSYHGDTGAVITTGLKIRSHWEEFYQDQHQTVFRQKVAEMVRLTGKAVLADANFKYQNGRLERVILRLKPASSENFSDSKQVTAEVRDWLKIVTDLPDEQIEVKWDVRN